VKSKEIACTLAPLSFQFILQTGVTFFSQKEKLYYCYYFFKKMKIEKINTKIIYFFKIRENNKIQT